MIKLYHHYVEKPFSEKNINALAEHFKGVFICFSALKGISSDWTDSAYAIFYKKNPNRELGHDHYFGIRAGLNDKVYIASAKSIMMPTTIQGLRTIDGHFIYSSCRHDYATYEVTVDNKLYTYMIDGGRDYTRMSTSVKDLATGVIEPFVEDTFARLMLLSTGPVLRVCKRNGEGLLEKYD